ncbi:MAG TPA: hypothetical protein VE988_15900 [Gemmataceae bacterium]|nr:hypothetical protein [Gemmataceae bacterium]
MIKTSNLDSKLNAIRTSFSGLVGARIAYYETAELLLEGGTWTPWPDLPIRLYTDALRLIAIAWSEFDNLWIETDSSLPFPIEESTIRWVRNSLEKINALVGTTIRSVMIGRGEMSVEGRDVEIWTRLLIQVGPGWLEIFNALDENGYDFHFRMPAGEFIQCI